MSSGGARNGRGPTNGGAAAAARGERWRPLKAILGGAVEVPEDFEISDLAQDSRSVRPGAAFLACRGRSHHGLEFAGDAVARGARAVLWEPAPGIVAPSLPGDVLSAAVPNLSAQLGFIADRFFDAPSAALTIAAVTGTNGKTTCAWLLAQALAACGREPAYIGTLGSGRPGAIASGLHTTPDAVTLHRRLAQLREQGADCVAMEVSSHALDQQRCAGVRFHTAVFTNLTRDHLDYHGDMAAYRAAKARLFQWRSLVARVINVDDDFGADLAREAAHGTRLVLTSQRRAEFSASNGEYVWASEVRARPDGLDLTLRTSWGEAQLASPLIGDFNVENLLSVLGVLLAWDVPLAQACAALARCSPPPGRMQRYGAHDAPLVIVDYAHTPDALAKALRAARAHCAGTLWCVFGCGGERDVGKRAPMGEVAATQADEIIVTDDNPRGEDPEVIVADILAGMTEARRAGVTVIRDRALAIRTAIARATRADVVLVAGKGHETYQIVGSERRAFSDDAAVRAALAARVVA